MNTKLRKPVQISVRDVLVSRLNVLEGRLAEYREKFPMANFTEATSRFNDAETVLRGFNPKTEDAMLVDYNLVKGDQMMVAAILQVSVQSVTEKKEKSAPEVKVTTTGQFVGETKTHKPVKLDGPNVLPLSALRDLKVAALAPNRSRKGDAQQSSKKEPKAKKGGSKRVPKAVVTTKKRATK